MYFYTNYITFTKFSVIIIIYFHKMTEQEIEKNIIPIFIESLSHLEKLQFSIILPSGSALKKEWVYHVIKLVVKT